MILDPIKKSQKLEQILLNFIDVLRINILMVDRHGMPVLVSQTSGYGFHGATQWGVLRHLGTPGFLSKFQTEGHYLKFMDAFGFQIFAVPVAVEGVDPMGYLIVGPVILTRQREQSQYMAIAQDLGLNFEDVQESLNQVRVVSFNSFKSILDLLCELSQYALRMKHTEKPPVPLEDKPAPRTPSVFATLLDLSMALSQAECGSIMLLNKLTNELSIEVFKGMDLQKQHHVPVKLGEGIAGLAAQKQESFVINEGERNNRIRHLLKKPELKCALVLPIIKNKEVLGVMNISTRQGTSRLATHSQEMLKSIRAITSGAFR